VPLVAKGIGVQTTKATMLDDAGVTLTESQASALVNIATLSDLYDRSVWYKCQAIAANLEYPTVSTLAINADGAALDCAGRTLVLDSASGAVYAPSGNTITIKAASLSTSAKFTSLKNVVVQTIASAVNSIDIAGTLKHRAR